VTKETHRLQPTYIIQPKYILLMQQYPAFLEYKCHLLADQHILNRKVERTLTLAYTTRDSIKEEL